MNAADRLCARAEGMLKPGMEVAFLTEQQENKKGKGPVVLVAIAKQCGTICLAIDAAEFDTAAQLDLAKRCGFSPPSPQESASSPLPASRGRRP